MDLAGEGGGAEARCPVHSIAKRFMIAGWVTAQNYITRNPAAVKAFISAIRKTAERANTHPDESRRSSRAT